jgi:hypothetical protein
VIIIITWIGIENYWLSRMNRHEKNTEIQVGQVLCHEENHHGATQPFARNTKGSVHFFLDRLDVDIHTPHKSYSP